jgi:hypothetical protein
MLGDWQLVRVCITCPTDGFDAGALVPALAELDALADTSPGFTWRWPRPAETPVGDGWHLIDFSIWQTVDALALYLDRAKFNEVLRRHHLYATRSTALRWVPRGRTPTWDEAYALWYEVTRKDHRHNTWEAFTLDEPVSPPTWRPFRKAISGEWEYASEDAPWIDLAAGREACAGCTTEIIRGDVRVTETRVDARGRATLYAYHLACAVREMPQVVQHLVGTRQLARELVPDPVAMYRETGDRIAALDEEARARRDARLAGGTADRDPVIEPLLAQLEDAPDDRGVLTVLADALAMRGDPRGELITTQLDGRSDLGARRDELRALVSLPFPPTELGNLVTWGIGYVAKLELGQRSADRIALLGALWRHPSLRVLQHLAVASQNATAALIADGPRTLRVLELGRDSPLGAIDELVALLPRLDQLRLYGRTTAKRLAHPKLRRLAVRGPCEQLLCDLDGLPALETIELYVQASTAPADLLCNFAGHVILTGALDLDAARMWRERVRGCKLARLDVSACKVDDATTRLLHDVTDELYAQQPLGDRIRHRAKPEWGIGTVVRRYDGKLEVSFGEAGVKVFRADAPFLELA